VAAFRMACQYCLRMMPRIPQQTQATWMLKLVQATPFGSPLHFPAIYFAMQVRPKDFGFVTLCKTLIDAGIQDHNDVYVIGRILRLPVVKNPTDVLLWLMKTACADKLLAEAALRTLVRPLARFHHVADLKVQAPLFIKRAVQFIALASERGKHNRRVWNCVRFTESVGSIKARWIATAVIGAATALAGIGQTGKLLSGRVPAGEADARVRDELQGVDHGKVDLKAYFDKIKPRLPMIDDEVSASSSRKAARSGKPTVAEARAKWKAGQYGSAKAVLDPDVASSRDGGVPNDDDDEVDEVPAAAEGEDVPGV